MQKITPHLWYDKEAKEAAAFYVSVFPGSADSTGSTGSAGSTGSNITSVRTIHDTPSGDCDIVSFVLCGQPFMAISAGPLFKFNPSISFQVRFASADDLDAAWARLVDGGSVLMPLGSYPFCDHYGWLADRYGLSWQLMRVDAAQIIQRITPVLMFVGDVCGRAEEAMSHYATVFPPAQVTVHARYGAGEEPDREGTVRFASFSLRGQAFGAMDSARRHDFAFNEAISFLVPCDTQEEIDSCWEQLAADPQAGQCGWLKDRYGVSWQIVPTAMDKLMGGDDPARSARVVQAFLKMKKFDIAALRRAADGA